MYDSAAKFHPIDNLDGLNVEMVFSAIFPLSYNLKFSYQLLQYSFARLFFIQRSFVLHEAIFRYDLWLFFFQNSLQNLVRCGILEFGYFPFIDLL